MNENNDTSDMNLFSALNRFRGLFTLASLIAVVWLAYVEPRKTRAYQVKVSDYDAISHAMASLVANDAYTYMLCMKKKNSAPGNDANMLSSKQELAESFVRRRVLVENLKIVIDTADRSFGKNTLKEINWFISWNQQLDQTEDDVCNQKFLTGNALRQWQQKVLTAMNRELS